MKIRLKVKVWARNNCLFYIGKDLFWLDSYKIEINELPVKWKANKLILKILSKEFWVLSDNIKILSWLNSTEKLIEII